MLWLEVMTVAIVMMMMWLLRCCFYQLPDDAAVVASLSYLASFRVSLLAFVSTISLTFFFLLLSLLPCASYSAEPFVRVHIRINNNSSM